MIQLEQQQHGEFVVGWVGWVGWVADTNYLYPARWGWIKNNFAHIPFGPNVVLLYCVIQITLYDYPYFTSISDVKSRVFIYMMPGQLSINLYDDGK